MVGTGLLLILFTSRRGTLETLELATYDLRFRLRGERPAAATNGIVVINDEGFAQLHQNLRTWPRAEYAD